MRRTTPEQIAEILSLVEAKRERKRAAAEPPDDLPGEPEPADEPPELNGAELPGVAVIRLSNVTPERVSWLWQDYLPAGKLVTLDGDPSVGKSTLAVHFAAVVSAGGRWPDGTACPAGDVLILSAEDGLADTIRPRCDAAVTSGGIQGSTTGCRRRKCRS